jgi:hypothetical protein
VTQALGWCLGTVDSYGHGVADLAHATVAQSSDALNENAQGHAFDGVEIDRGGSGYGIVGRFEHNLARKASNGRRARSYQGPAQPRNGCIAAEDNHGSATNVG